MKRTVQLAVAAAIIITLGSCVWNPTDGTGSVTLAISSPALSSLAVGDSGMEKADSDAVRIWLYYDGVELPVTDVGYVQATVDPGTVKELTIENLPEGDGYSIAVVRGVMDSVVDSVVFQPVAIGDADFVVTGGRETAVAVATTQLDELVRVDSVDYILLGQDLVGAVAIPYLSNDVFVAASSSTVFYATALATADAAPNFATVNFSSTVDSIFAGISDPFSSLSPVELPRSLFPVELPLFESNVSAVFVNTAKGILDLTPVTGGLSAGTDLIESMTSEAITNLTGSGVFNIAGEGTAIFFDRLGGFGGTFVEQDDLVFDDSSGLGGVSDWVDMGGADLQDYVADDQSPVFAYATNGTSAAYMATRLGTFRMDEDLFDSDVEVSVDSFLDSSIVTPGLNFFAAAYPGSTRPLKIRHMALAGSGTSEKLVIGSPRGAFLFPSSAVESLDANGLVSGVVTVEAVRDQEVKNLTVVEVDGVDYIVAVTDERIVVVKVTNATTATPLFMQPVRAMVLGEPQELSAYESGSGVLTLLISGSEGLTKLDVKIPQI